MLAEIPSATRAGSPAGRRLQDQARHQRATKRLPQTMETQQFEEHRPPWPESWRLKNVCAAGEGLWLQLWQRLLSDCCLEYFMAAYTHPHAPSIGHIRRTGSRSLGAGAGSSVLVTRRA